jgi:hypothetical protein
VQQARQHNTLESLPLSAIGSRNSLIASHF